MPWYVFLPIALTGAVGLGLAFHGLIRRLGDSGLVDYLPAPPTRKSVAGAMMTFQGLFEPAVDHVIEYQRTGDLTIQTSGEPGPPADPAPLPPPSFLGQRYLPPAARGDKSYALPHAPLPPASFLGRRYLPPAARGNKSYAFPEPPKSDNS